MQVCVCVCVCVNVFTLPLVCAHTNMLSFLAGISTTLAIGQRGSADQRGQGEARLTGVRLPFSFYSLLFFFMSNN